MKLRHIQILTTAPNIMSAGMDTKKLCIVMQDSFTMIKQMIVTFRIKLTAVVSFVEVTFLFYIILIPKVK